MPIPEELERLIERLNLELRQIEQIVTDGIDLTRPILSQFPENTLLIQFFAYLNNVYFLVNSYKERMQNNINLLLLPDITTSELQEVGQDLSMMLGVVLETKMKVMNIVDRLKNLS